MVACRRINIGQQYQAEIPDLQDPLSSQFDQHKADLVWLPLDDSIRKHGHQESGQCFAALTEQEIVALFIPYEICVIVFIFSLQWRT